MQLSQSEQKKLVAQKAIDDLIAKGLLGSHMRLGLGTGSTAMPAVERIAEHLASGTLTDIKAVATSFQTTIACERLNIPVFSMNSKEIKGKLDFAIDGADEISPEGQLIKGGGAALLLEKIVAYNSKLFVVIADESKLVPDLGIRFSLPIEIIPEARTSVTQACEKLGAKVVLREGIKKAGPVVTDNGNFILDCLWTADAKGKSPIKPAKLEIELNQIVGVVENGFFTQTKPRIYVAKSDGLVLEYFS